MLCLFWCFSLPCLSWRFNDSVCFFKNTLPPFFQPVWVTVSAFACNTTKNFLIFMHPLLKICLFYCHFSIILFNQPYQASEWKSFFYLHEILHQCTTSSLYVKHRRHVGTLKSDLLYFHSPALTSTPPSQRNGLAYLTIGTLHSQGGSRGPSPHLVRKGEKNNNF